MQITDLLTPGLVVAFGTFLWRRIDSLDKRLSATITGMDRRLARVEGQLSVMIGREFTRGGGRSSPSD